MRRRLALAMGTAAVLAAVPTPVGVASPSADLAAGPADTVPPRGAVAGLRSPATGVLTLWLDADDDGSGLATAEVRLGGVLAADAILASAACPASCRRAVRAVPLAVPTSIVSDGAQPLTVTVTDHADHASVVLDVTITVANVPRTPSTPSATVVVGDGGSSSVPPAGTDALGPAGTPSGAAATAGACASPRLTALLSQRPSGVRAGRAVVVAGRRYRFRGRLTCVTPRGRRSAPAGTPVAIWHRVRGRWHRKSGTTTRADGRFTVVIAIPSSRVVRFGHPDGSPASQVRIGLVAERRGRR